MSATPEKEIAAAREFYAVIVDKLTNEQGVHAETAIASVGRMAGTFLLRSCNLPLGNLEPGAPVFSDAVNEQGPILVELFSLMLQQMNITIDPSRFESFVGQADAPKLDVLATQALVENDLNNIRQKHQLNYNQAARAAAIASAIMVQKCAQVVDPHIGFQVATYCFVEGSKTVPRRLVADNVEKKPWYKRW